MILLKPLVAGSLLSVACLTFAQEPSEKLPVPDDDAQKQAVALIANLYKAEYEAAKTPEQRIALAKKMLQVGVESRNDLIGRYALLRIAKDTAAGAGDVETALAAVEFLDKHYEVDVLSMKAAVMAKVAKALRLPKDHQGFANVLRVTTYAAIAKDRFDLAKAINDIAVSSARQARNIDLIKEVVQRRNEIEEVERSYQDVKEAVAVLDRSPTDPEANLLVGQYRCFVRGDWDTGLPMLALGGDEKLKALATSEFAEAPDPLDLGNAWWEYSDGLEGKARTAVRQRAASWYRKAMPKLGGLTKQLVESRLEMVATAIPPTPQSEPNSPTDDAIALALSWLVRQQRPDGGWSLQIGPNPGNFTNDVAATSLAIIPMLRAGNTHKKGPLAPNVEGGITFLLRQMKANGDLRGRQTKGVTMYAHGLGAIAICEAYLRSRDRRLKAPAQAAINFIVSAQDPNGGGWRYEPRQSGDTSVLGWQMTPLMLARESDLLEVPQQTFAGVSKYLDSVQADDGNSYGYTKPGSGPSTSAIGLMSRLYLGAEKKHPVINRGIERIMGKHANNVYFNYYAAQLLYLAESEHWDEWKKRLDERLLARQEKVGPTAGSWFTDHEESSHVARNGGRLAVTSFCLMALQVGD